MAHSTAQPRVVRPEMTPVLLFLATCFLAYSNGANDNFKGVASLYGSRTASFRTALAWATVTTFAGSISAIFLAQSLLKKFSGKGLVTDALASSPSFLLAVVLGSACTVILATLTGFPVSTTHALTGALVGGGLVAAGALVNFAALGKNFVTPLVLGPVLAIALGAVLYLALRFLRLRFGLTKEWCLCVGVDERVVAMPQPAALFARPSALSEVTTTIGEMESCSERYAGSFLGVRAQSVMDAFHFLSAGVVGFARGLNDTPKIAAMLLLLHALDIRWGFAAIAVMMGIGGLLSARKVAETMSKRITAMNHGQGFSANLATGILVILASAYGLPVSTTHVSVGALFGIGLTTGNANPRVVRNIVLSWVITLPCAAALSGVAYWLIARLNAG